MLATGCQNLSRLNTKLSEVLWYFFRTVKIVSEYDQQTTPWHREEELLNHHETPGRQIKQSNQPSLPHQDDCNTRTDIK